MTKFDKFMTSAFRKIHRENVTRWIDVMQMIRTLGKTLLNLQQMSSQKEVHIALSLPSNSISKECIFINRYLPSERTFIINPPFLLK
jgi:hypothetical protein